MTEYNEGDLVEAVKGKRRVIDQVVIPPKGPLFQDGPYLGAPSLFGPSSIASYKDAGYVVTVVERATPPLPTEPGLYLSAKRDGDIAWIFQLDDLGNWNLLNTNSLFPVGDGFLERHAPFTRLEPVPVTAKKALDRVRQLALASRLDQMIVRSLVLDNIAAEFGVEP